MTAPDRAAAVEIARDTLVDYTAHADDMALAAVAALDAAGWLHDPKYVAALEAEVELLRAREAIRAGGMEPITDEDLDARPASETGSGEAVPHVTECWCNHAFKVPHPWNPRPEQTDCPTTGPEPRRVSR